VPGAVDDRVEHRPDRVARGEDRLLVTKRGEIDRMPRLERLDVGIAGPVKREPVAIRHSAEELPRRDVSVAAKQPFALERAIRAGRFQGGEEFLDRGLRLGAQAQRWPLDPVVREIREKGVDFGHFAMDVAVDERRDQLAGRPVPADVSGEAPAEGSPAEP